MSGELISRCATVDAIVTLSDGHDPLFEPMIRLYETSINERERDAVEAERLGRWLREIYVEVYGRDAGDLRLAGMMQGLPAEVALE